MANGIDGVSPTTVPNSASPQPEASYKIWKPIVLMMIVALGAFLVANYGFAEKTDWKHLFEGKSIYPLIVGGGLDLLLLGYLFYGIYQNSKQIANETTPSSPATTTTPSAAAGSPISTSPTVYFTVKINELNNSHQVVKQSTYSLTRPENETLKDLYDLFISNYQPTVCTIGKARILITVNGAEPSDNTTIKEASKRGPIMILVSKDPLK